MFPTPKELEDKYQIKIKLESTEFINHVRKRMQEWNLKEPLYIAYIAYTIRDIADYVVRELIKQGWEASIDLDEREGTCIKISKPNNSLDVRG